MKYDYLIVGSGLFGSVLAREMTQKGRRCLVVERRGHTGGNIYCEEREGINVHKYGAHIFHTNSKEVWDYVNRFVEFNNYVNSPVANYKGEIYNLPFNMNTFSKMWNIVKPEEAKAIIDKQKKAIKGDPQNLEEQAISLVGEDIYRKLIKGYTEKQWGRDCKELPAFIIKRLPVRYTYDNNYFNARYQGIPVGGYNRLIEKLLSGVEVCTGVQYDRNNKELREAAENVIYTGPLDEYFGYELGTLEYRGLKFETERLEMENYQGVAVMNFTEREIPYTRIIEHKHFEFGNQQVTYVTREYPQDWKKGDEAYYPVNNQTNQELYEEYKKLAQQDGLILGGRLAEYKYYDMDQTILSALELSKRLND